MTNRIPGDANGDIFNDMNSDTLPDSTPRREGGEDSEAERIPAINTTGGAIEKNTSKNKEHQNSGNLNILKEEIKQEADTTERNK